MTTFVWQHTKVKSTKSNPHQCPSDSQWQDDNVKHWECPKSPLQAHFVKKASSLVVKCPVCCTDVMGLIPGPDTCDRQRLGQELHGKMLWLLHRCYGFDPRARHLWQAMFGARAALVAVLSKMCWTCLSSTASLPDSTEKSHFKKLISSLSYRQ